MPIASKVIARMRFRPIPFLPVNQTKDPCGMTSTGRPGTGTELDIRQFGTRLVPLGFFALLLSLTACDVSRDPETGRQNFDLILPGTQVNAERREREWQKCLETRSPTRCHRDLGPRPQPAPDTENTATE